jgi:hypothetical protein
MSVGFRVVGVSFLVALSLVSSSVLAGEHAQPTAAAKDAGSKERATADKKASLQVSPVKEWDPDMELVPFDAKEGLRLMIAYTRTQIQALERNPDLSDEEKAKERELLEKFMKSLLVTFRSVNEHTSVSTGVFICLGAEVPLTFLLPEKAKFVKPSVAGSGCGLLAFTKNYGANSFNGFVFGIGAMAGVQVANNDKTPEGAPLTGQIEMQTSFGMILPLNGRAPVLKVGDIQGYYVGGGVEFATESNNKLLNNKGTGSFGAYAKIDGLHKPDVAILMGTLGKNDQLAPFHLKGEGFYFTVPWATDGSSFRTPTVPLTDISLNEQGAKSQHAPKERIRKYTSAEVLELIKASKAELKNVK